MAPTFAAEDARRDERDFTDGLPSFAEVVLALAAVDPGDEAPGHMDIARMRVSFPVELEIEADEGGQVTVCGSPPLLTTSTSVMPVFHQLEVGFLGGGAHGG